jgi:hypothetical protein
MGPQLIVNNEINIMVSSKNSSKFLFLYYSKLPELVECGILQKYFYGFEKQN